MMSKKGQQSVSSVDTASNEQNGRRWIWVAIIVVLILLVLAAYFFFSEGGLLSAENEAAASSRANAANTANGATENTIPQPPALPVG